MYGIPILTCPLALLRFWSAPCRISHMTYPRLNDVELGLVGSAFSSPPVAGTQRSTCVLEGIQRSLSSWTTWSATDNSKRSATHESSRQSSLHIQSHTKHAVLTSLSRRSPTRLSSVFGTNRVSRSLLPLSTVLRSTCAHSVA